MTRDEGQRKIPRIFFYCSSEPGNLQEDIIALAEGFRELGVPYFSNCNYWRQSVDPDDYLFRHDSEVTHEECDIVVVSYTWPQWVKMGTFDMVRKPLPRGIFKEGRKFRTVYMDNHDGYRTVSWEREFRQFDLILRSKFTSRAWHPDNMHPWAYGLTNRVISATSEASTFRNRRHALLVNFGASHPYRYGIRDLAKIYFEPAVSEVLEIDKTTDDLSKLSSDPYEALMWRQTGGRFSRGYYDRIKNSSAVACFCGHMIPPMPFRNADKYLVGGGRAKLRRMLFEAFGRFDRRPPRAVGCDSFRFWESLAAGCASINIDLEYYGVDMPVMPSSWKHYIGIKFSRLEETIDRLRNNVAEIERVAAAGRLWSEEHYSPKAVAQRFLELF